MSGNTQKRRTIRAGSRVGLLKTIRSSGRSSDGHKKWLCRCDCGNLCIRQSSSLRNSQRRRAVASCGCLSGEVNRRQATTHGMRNSPEYASWRSAKERCHNPNSKDFFRYGAKGVLVCDEWLNSFDAFYRDMGPRPPGTSLDRWPDRSGNYAPGNCRWATPKEQSNNRKNTTFVVGPSGRVSPLSSIASEFGITYGAAFMRLQRGKLDGYRRV